MGWLEALSDELVARHEAEAVLLYGSRARGDARPESDVDICVVVTRADTKVTRDARQIPGPDGHLVDLDAWVHPIATLDADKDPSLMRLRGGVPLADPRGVAVELLAALEARWAAGPTPLPEDERQALSVWGQRMLRRIQNRTPGHELASAFRRAELVAQLLPDLFSLRCWWYPGPEPGLAELRRRDPDLFAAYAAALDPMAPDRALTELVTRVFSDVARPGP